MADSQKKQFQIRNRRHFIVGTYSEQEIINRIADGKYQGNEEVSSEPFLSWQKISSHPDFYDAFLKRLFVQGYQMPKTTEPLKSDFSKKSQEASRIHLMPLLSEEPSVINKQPQEEAQVTQQLLTEQNHSQDNFEGEKEIEKLFLEAGNTREESRDLQGKIEEIFIQEGNPFDAPLINESESSQKLELTQSSAGNLFFVTEPTDLKESDNKTAKRKRIIAIAVVLALVFLYQMGQSGPESKSDKIESSSNSNLGALSSGTALNKEELISALTEEAFHFYDFDTPLHYSGALSLFREAFHLNPDDPQLVSGVILAQAHLFEQDPNNVKVEEEIKYLIANGRKTEPHLSSFYRAEAILAYYKKNTDLALEKIRYAQESDPSDTESIILEAEFLNSIGDRVQARNRIDRALSKETGRVRGYFIAAQIALDMGDLEGSEQYAKKVLQLNQLHANAHFILAETYQRQGKKGAAIAHLDLVTKLAPLASRPILADAHFSLAKLVEDQGNTSGATKHNKLAFYFSNGSLPGLKQKISDINSDKDNLRELAKEQEYDMEFYNSRAEELFRENQNILGLEYLQVTRLLEPNNPLPLIKVAEGLEKLAISYKKLKRVEILYERAIQKDPTYLDSYIKLSAIETEQYNFDEAYKLLNQASNQIGFSEVDSFVTRGCQDKFTFSSTAKDEYKVCLAWGKHFFKRENYDCSAAFLQQAQIASPVNSDVFFYFGKLAELYKSDDLQRVINYYYQAFIIDPLNYEALASWGRTKAKLGEKNYVIKYLRALIEADPQNSNLFWVLGETYSENQEYQRAIIFYKKAIDYNPRFSKARISLARSLSAIGQTDQAISEFSYAASTDRRNGVGFFEAAQLQTINKKFKDAELLVKALIEATPNYPGSHRLLSQIYQFMDKKNEAIAEMVKETQNNPQNTKFAIDLAEIYIGYQKYELAIQVLSKIVNLPGENKAPAFRADRTQAFLLLSRSLRALTRPDNAEGAIKLALEIDKEDPELHRELGYVYHDLQRYREGVKEFELYLQRKPAGTDVDNIKGLIKKMLIED